MPHSASAVYAITLKAKDELDRFFRAEVFVPRFITGVYEMKATSSSQPAADLHQTDLHELIRRRAEEIYVRSGRMAGRDLENWTKAEQEIRAEVDGRPAARRNAVVVKVDGVEYVGEYHPNAADGYSPGEFAAGDPVRIRFQGDKMLIQRPNGKELETTIVKDSGR